MYDIVLVGTFFYLLSPRGYSWCFKLQRHPNKQTFIISYIKSRIDKNKNFSFKEILKVYKILLSRLSYINLHKDLLAKLPTKFLAKMLLTG